MRCEVVRGNGSKHPRSPNLGSRQEKLETLTPRPSPLVPTTPNGPQGQNWRYGEYKSLLPRPHSNPDIASSNPRPSHYTG